MTSLHGLCRYEFSTWQPLVDQYLIANQLDEYVSPCIIQYIVAYITPHPCSNQIMRPRPINLRFNTERSRPNFDIYLFWKSCKDRGLFPKESISFVDAVWNHHQHLDATDILDSCDVCQRGRIYMPLFKRIGSSHQ